MHLIIGRPFDIIPPPKYYLQIGESLINKDNTCHRLEILHVLVLSIYKTDHTILQDLEFKIPSLAVLEGSVVVMTPKDEAR